MLAINDKALELPPALAGWIVDSFYSGFNQTLCIIYLAKAGLSYINRTRGNSIHHLLFVKAKYS